MRERWIKYFWIERGFVRISIGRLRLVWTTKKRACYSDRTHGLKIGRFIVRASIERGFDVDWRYMGRRHLERDLSKAIEFVKSARDEDGRLLFEPLDPSSTARGANGR